MKCDVDFLEQMIESMAEAVDKLEEAEKGNKIEEFNKMKEFILKLQVQIKGACND